MSIKISPFSQIYQTYRYFVDHPRELLTVKKIVGGSILAIIVFNILEELSQKIRDRFSTTPRITAVLNSAYEQKDYVKLLAIAEKAKPYHFLIFSYFTVEDYRGWVPTHLLSNMIENLSEGNDNSYYEDKNLRLCAWKVACQKWRMIISSTHSWIPRVSTLLYHPRSKDEDGNYDYYPTKWIKPEQYLFIKGPDNWRDQFTEQDIDELRKYKDHLGIMKEYSHGGFRLYDKQNNKRYVYYDPNNLKKDQQLRQYLS